MINQSIYPLISCLCITHKKPDMLQRVIRCFDNQSYPNKQMVIVYEESDQLTHEFIAQHTFDYNTKIVNIGLGSKKTLGELRNISVREADGEYVCQWDDDDWYDPDRLSEQMNVLLLNNKPACVLSRWIVFDACSQKAYLSNRRLWEGSILCKRDRMLQNPYPQLSKGEDSNLINCLYEHGELSIIEDMPNLYVYIYHGDNTWEYAHFKQIFDYSKELSLSFSKEVFQIINDSD